MIEGKDVLTGNGFCKTYIRQSLENPTRIDVPDYIKSIPSQLSKSADLLMVRSVIIHPINQRFFLYVDSGRKKFFTEDDRTSFRILGELPDVARFDNVGQVVAYASLSPQQHTSGSSVRKRTKLTKTGNQNIKTALFFPALSAIRYNPIVKALATRLESQGKEKMVIVGAAMRKLLQLIYGILKSGQPFDPNYSANIKDAT